MFHTKVMKLFINVAHLTSTANQEFSSVFCYFCTNNYSTTTTGSSQTSECWLCLALRPFCPTSSHLSVAPHDRLDLLFALVPSLSPTSSPPVSIEYMCLILTCFIFMLATPNYINSSCLNIF